MYILILFIVTSQCLSEQTDQQTSLHDQDVVEVPSKDTTLYHHHSRPHRPLKPPKPDRPSPDRPIINTEFPYPEHHPGIPEIRPPWTPDENDRPTHKPWKPPSPEQEWHPLPQKPDRPPWLPIEDSYPEVTPPPYDTIRPWIPPYTVPEDIFG